MKLNSATIGKLRTGSGVVVSELGAPACTIFPGGGPLQMEKGVWRGTGRVSCLIPHRLGQVMRLATGTAAGPRTAPRAELHVSLWVAEGPAGDVPIWCVGWPIGERPGWGGGLGTPRRPWRGLVAAHPPPARWVAAHAPAPGAEVTEVDRRLNGLAEFVAKAAAAEARVAAWRAERLEALRHLRMVHDAFAVGDNPPLSAAAVGGPERATRAA